MEEISCVFCHVDNAPVVIEDSGFTGKKCNNCPLIYISPRPSENEVIDIYGHSNAHICPQSHITESYFKRLHSKHTLRLIKKYKKSGKILEIGAGGGFFLNEARKAGFDPYAIELNPVQASFIKNTLWICCDQKPFTKQSFGSLKFDVIYHSDVISHFHDPIAVFKDMYEKLNPGGIVIFETGNVADVDPKYYRLFNSFQYPDHLFFFGESSLKTLLSDSQFKLKMIRRYSITLHLRLLKLIGSQSKQQMPTQNLTTGKQGLAKRIIKRFFHAGLYAMRYKIGAWLPKNKRPQTIIMIAQKS